jgi:CubicO group peptidase (beta-lactamase class C family)
VVSDSEKRTRFDCWLAGVCASRVFNGLVSMIYARALYDLRREGGNAGEFYKGGAAGAIFWVDPNEKLMAVFMVNAPDYREHDRFLMKTLIGQAILNHTLPPKAGDD